jgi:oxygen tolerance protein BatD
LALLLLLAVATPASAEVEVRAKIEPEVIGIDETATFSIEVHGDSFSSLLFRPDFELDNLEILGPPSRYEDMRFVDRRFSRTLRLSWRVRPLGLGKARARAITVQLNDEVLRIPACELDVQQEPAQQARRGFGGFQRDADPFQQFFGRMPNPWRREPRQPEVFLRAEIQPQQPVMGQQVLYSLYLYTREDIAALSPSGVPTFRGFWVRDIQLPQQLPTEMVEIAGRRYGRVPLLRKALFPLRSGRFAVEPAVVDLTVQHYDRRFFFGPPVARSEQLRLRTEGQWIDVRPLPPAPPGFGGAVGRLALKTELQPRQIRLGEAATLTVRLSGTGNLQGIREPRMSLPAGLILFPPQQEGRDEVAGTTVRGSRIWRYVVVADRAGRYTLQGPKISYFDPGAGRYRLAAAPDTILQALPRPTDPAAGGGAPHGIRTAALSSGGSFGRRWQALLPWLLALAWGVALVVILARRRAVPAEGGPAFAAGAGASRNLADGLRQAEGEKRPRQVAVRIEEAWRGLLAERWNIPAEAPLSRWRELLAARGTDSETLEEMGRLVEDLRYLRNAPQLSATDSLRSETLRRSRRLLRRLR